MKKCIKCGEEEPELKYEYLRKLYGIKKQKGISFKTISDLRKHTENA